LAPRPVQPPGRPRRMSRKRDGEETGNGADDPAQPHYAGHRERLRERFKTAGASALADYELLELLLFRILPRRDTKPIAKAMLARFGSFSEALGAPAHLLAEIDGLGPTAIADLKVVLAAAQRIGRDAVQEKPLMGSWREVIDYCTAQMAYES